MVRMAGLIVRKDIDLVRERTDLKAVVEEFVTLRSAGVGSFKGLCPFHDERTPSFHVRPGVGTYHCFGCGAHGDVISFLMELEHTTFTETVERLASRVGVELHYEDGGTGPDKAETGRRRRLFEANKVADEFFRRALGSPEAQAARDFLTQRGFTQEHAAQFGLGYAPQGWSHLLDHLRHVVTRILQLANQHPVLDSVREPIVLIDGSQRVVMHNAAFAELYGVDEDARGRPLTELGGGAWDNPDTLRRLHDVLARDRELWDYRLSQPTADGVERTMLINARRMPLPDRDDPVALITASDVTAQTISERQIRELNQQLEGKVEQVSDVNRELEAFSYSVSHDLRAPLRHIAGFADKLGRHLGENVDDKTTHYLGVIGSSAKRMSALIDDLLVYSRLGRNAMRLQSVDLQSMVNDVRAMLDSNAHAENPEHRIAWSVAPLPIVVGDENMLRQVWMNLLGNAVKYSSGTEPARITVDVKRLDEGGYQFCVADNGAGFDMQYAGKLFGVFQRLHSANEFPGTGVGLASVRRVLGRHGGRIWAEAEPGNGATFHFTLPASGQDAGANATGTH